TSPHGMIGHDLTTRKPVLVVVADVEAALSDDATRSTENRMEHEPVGWRGLCFDDEGDHLGVRAALTKEPTNRREVEDLPHVPALEDSPTEVGRLLIVEKIVLLQEAEHAPGLQKPEALVQEKIGDLLVRQRPVLAAIRRVARPRARRRQLGPEGGISEH